MDIVQTMELIKRHEGLRLKPYRCSAGKLSIGFGRNLDDVGISVIEADSLLENDVYNVRQGLEGRLPWFDGLDDVRQAVLVDMAYNLGIVGLMGFRRTLEHVQAGRWSDAAREMLDSKWATQVGARANRLATMMETGRWAV